MSKSWEIFLLRRALSSVHFHGYVIVPDTGECLTFLNMATLSKVLLTRLDCLKLPFERHLRLLTLFSVQHCSS